MTWRYLPDSAPATHAWQGEYVIHHALSNDTHRITGPTARILSEVIAAGSECAVDPGRSLSLSDDDIQATLDSLVDLGYIARC